MLLKKSILIISLVLGLISIASGQFIETTPDSLKNIAPILGDADWGDYDNDGDLDLFLIGLSGDSYYGKPVTILFENKNGSLVKKDIGLPGVYSGSCDWGDFDNDGDLDILVMGKVGSLVTNSIQSMRIYINTNGSFTLLESSISQLPQISEGNARWVDFNNDGLLDIVCTGNNLSTNYYAIPGVFQSMGNGNFVRRFSLVSTQGGTFDVGDFDNDGDTDLVLSNLDITIYRNDGNWIFTPITKDFIFPKPQGYPWADFFGDIVWADMDNNGKLDLVASGTLDYGVTSFSSTVIFQNQDTIFKELVNTTPTNGAYNNSVEFTELAIGDYNNDGAADVLISTPALSLLNNNGHGDLAEANLTFPSVANAGAYAIRWADYDHDHNLDFYAEPKLLRNTNTTQNTPPNPPTLLTIDSVYNNTVYFHWDSGSDKETVAEGLTYQFYVGTQPQQQDKINSNSSLSNGLRKLAEPGVAKGKNWKLNLKGGKYYFGVQSIDPSFEGSIFSPEASAIVIEIEAKGQSTCTGYTSTYIAKPSDAYAWAIKGGTIISGQGTDSVIVKWDVVGQGIVMVSNAHGDKNTLEVLTGNKPKPVIFGNTKVCTQYIPSNLYYDNYKITDALSDSIIWSSTNPSAFDNYSKNAVDKIWTAAGNQMIMAKAFSKNGACFSYDTLLVNVDQRPNLPIITGLDQTCTEELDLYTSYSSSTVWNVSNGQIMMDSVKKIKVLWSKDKGSGKVIAVVSSTHGYCSVLDTKNITINPSPPKKYLDGVSICSGNAVVIKTDAPDPIWEVTNGTVLWDSIQRIKVYWPTPGTGSVGLTEPMQNGVCVGLELLPVTIKYCITEIESTDSPLSIYPNPADKKIILQMTNVTRGEYQLKLYSSTSALIKQLVIHKEQDLLNYEMDVSDLTPGLYLLRLTNKEESHTLRFIKL